MINFVCVHYGLKYNVDYVINLFNMVNRNLTLPHKFICFTDNVTLINKQKLDIDVRTFKRHDFDGWWNKLQLFSPESNLEGDNLYMDLDVVIMKNIDCFTEIGNENNFVGMNDFNPTTKIFNSSIMKFNNKTATKLIWDKYINDRVKWRKYAGDQNVISELIYNHKDTISFPDSWTQSYKWYDRKGERYHKSKWTFEQHPEAKVCVFHGFPNPHESDQNWVKNNWK